jgi:addiction module RelB/DinJ family antitoxin
LNAARVSRNEFIFQDFSPQRFLYEIILYLCGVNLNQIEMSQVSMTVRMDSQLKTIFEALCSEFGMSVNTAINVFARTVVQRRCIPFEIRADEKKSVAERMAAFRNMREWAENGNTLELTLEEINEEIDKTRTKK